MTPVHPIDTSGAAQPRERRQTGWRRPPTTFQIPDDNPPAAPLRVPMIAAPAILPADATTAASGLDQTQADQARHQFVDSVARVVRAPQRITGWFVDLTV
jgi:hypothetical protein